MKKNHPIKLVLNRETLRDLSLDDLAHIDGGQNRSKGPGCTTSDPSDPQPCWLCVNTCGC